MLLIPWGRPFHFCIEVVPPEASDVVAGKLIDLIQDLFTYFLKAWIINADICVHATFVEGLLLGVPYMILTKNYRASKQVLLPNSVIAEGVLCGVLGLELGFATTVSHLLLCA